MIRPQLNVHFDSLTSLRGVSEYPMLDLQRAVQLVAVAGAERMSFPLLEDRRPQGQANDIQLVLELRKREELNVPVFVTTELNSKMLSAIHALKPDGVCFVSRQGGQKGTLREVSLEGGPALYQDGIGELRAKGIQVNLFLEPELTDLEWASDLKPDGVELDAGALGISIQNSAMERGNSEVERELNRICTAADRASELGLSVGVGAELDYEAIRSLVELDRFLWFGIGQSIMCRSVFVGLRQAVREMNSLLHAP